MLKESVLFFPGVVFHELSHVIACTLTGVKIQKVKWFGTDEAFVQHDKPNAWQGLLITVAPFVLGSIIGFQLLLFGHAMLSAWSPTALLVYWFALSVLLYSFPSKQDALNAFNAFSDFYRRRVLEKGPLLERLVWMLSFPFFFVPVILILGFILLFDTAFVLRFLWVAAILIISFSG